MKFEPSSGFARDSVQRFQSVLTDFVDTLGNLAALAAVDVTGRGRVYFSAGHADLSRVELASPQHLFQIGSQTKTLVALTMLVLEDRGLVGLDDYVVKHLDLPIDSRITVRHLLMNTCGLGDKYLAIPWNRLDPRLPTQPRDIIALTLPQGQLFEPGNQFDYCNVGWVIAALLIEKVTDKPHGQAIAENLLEPLGLKSSMVGGTPDQARMLRGYIQSQATHGMIDTSNCLKWVYGSGDAVSSLDDMLDLFGGLGSGHKLGLSLDRLTAATAKPPENPYVPFSIGAEYGLGVERRLWAGREVWGHPGSTLAYLTGSWVDAGRGVTVTTCVTRAIATDAGAAAELRYPRAQLFAMALDTACVGC